MNKSFARISRAIREGQGALVTSPKETKISPRTATTSQQEAKETTKQVEGIAGTTNEKSPLDASNVNMTATTAPKKKTLAQLDEELRQKMSGLGGEGNEAAVQYDENGKPIDMARSVKNNMFRYI